MPQPPIVVHAIGTYAVEIGVDLSGEWPWGTAWKCFQRALLQLAFTGRDVIAAFPSRSKIREIVELVFPIEPGENPHWCKGLIRACSREKIAVIVDEDDGFELEEASFVVAKPGTALAEATEIASRLFGPAARWRRADAAPRIEEELIEVASGTDGYAILWYNCPYDAPSLLLRVQQIATECGFERVIQS